VSAALVTSLFCFGEGNATGECGHYAQTHGARHNRNHFRHVTSWMDSVYDMLANGPHYDTCKVAEVRSPCPVPLPGQEIYGKPSEDL
jgi:hypothetical protein